MRLRAEELVVGFDGTAALAGASLDVAAGETLALLGPSGCGKSTLLRAIAGLQRLDGGRVLLDGRDLGGTPPHRRGIGLMFQEHALFPHRDVAGNVGFGLRMAGTPRAEIARSVVELLGLVGLDGMGKRSVETLSGGEQQRVALARALAPGPPVLLLDEPLGSLDRPLHDRLLDELGEVFRRLQQTVLYVTHDVAEAFALGDRVAVMRAGRIVQTATPNELWSRPANGWVARFLGLANVEPLGESVRITRPEAIGVERSPAGEATVIRAERSGAVVTLTLRDSAGRELEAVVAGVNVPAPGDRVALRIDPAGVVFVPAGD
ncbi:MAG: ABC transporter ATP-binding protein [Gaiellaceae bacterium MAG52_C11]|nr:ABC transporter ATP-binding protein [Candidatus Gaiellasilicea maunaloa]